MAVVNMEHPEKGGAIVEDWDVERMESHGFKRADEKSPKRRRRTTPKPPDSEHEE